MHPRRLIVAALVAITAGLAVAGPVFAHIDPDPTEAQAGSEQSVGFTVQHGCEGSPTVQLDMRLPEGTANPVPEPPAGWTGSVDANVVTFQGGPLPDDQELTFRVRMTLPPTPDTTIYFPFVQRCEAGEIRWIEIPTDGAGSELDEPAPAMQLFGPVAAAQPAPTTSTPPTTAVPTTAVVATSAPGISTTIAPATTMPVTEPTGPTATQENTRPSTVEDPSDSESTGTVVFVAVLAALAAVAGTVVVRARRRRP